MAGLVPATHVFLFPDDREAPFAAVAKTLDYPGITQIAPIAVGKIPLFSIIIGSGLQTFPNLFLARSGDINDLPPKKFGKCVFDSRFA